MSALNPAQFREFDPVSAQVDWQQYSDNVRAKEGRTDRRSLDPAVRTRLSHTSLSKNTFLRPMYDGEYKKGSLS